MDESKIARVISGYAKSWHDPSKPLVNKSNRPKELVPQTIVECSPNLHRATHNLLPNWPKGVAGKTVILPASDGLDSSRIVDLVESLTGVESGRLRLAGRRSEAKKSRRDAVATVALCQPDRARIFVHRTRSTGDSTSSGCDPPILVTAMDLPTMPDAEAGHSIRLSCWVIHASRQWPLSSLASGGDLLLDVVDQLGQVVVEVEVVSVEYTCAEVARGAL